MFKFKKFATLATAAAMCFAFASCGPAQSGGGLIKVGIINNDPNESGYRTANDKDMKNTFTKENGFDASFAYSLKNDEQINHAQKFIQDEVDYLLLSAADPAGWDSVLKDAKEAGAFIVGTGASQYANQINNVLVFPGLFRGALDVRASTVNKEMMIAASYGIASCVSDEELSVEYILPYAYDQRAHAAVAKAVAAAAVATGVNKI